MESTKWSDAVKVLVEFGLRGPSGPRLSSRCSNGTPRAWSDRDNVWCNLAKWRECYNDDVLTSLANGIGEGESKQIRRHRLSRREWFRSCNEAFLHILDALPIRYNGEV